MKRVWLVIASLVLAAFVPVAAFAQLQWDGYYRAGGMYVDPATGDGTLNYIDRLRLNVSFMSQDKTMGVAFRMQGNGSSTAASGSSTFLTDLTGDTGSVTTSSGTGFLNAFAPSAGDIKYGYGWLSLANNMVKVSAGKLNVSDYEVTENTGNYFLGNVATDDLAPGKPLLGNAAGNTTGAIVQVMPMSGLSLGLFSHIDGTAIDVSDFGAAARYDIPNVGSVLVNSALGSFYNGDADLGASYVSAAFKYTGMQGLAATLGVRYDGDTVYAAMNDAAVSILAILEYTAGPLFADLSTESDFSNGSYYVEGEVDYTVIPQLKLRGYGAYDSTGTYAKTTVANKTMFGADVVVPAGAAEIDAGLAWGDQSNIVIPVFVKVSF